MDVKNFNSVTAGYANVTKGRKYSITWEQKFKTEVVPALGTVIANNVTNAGGYYASIQADHTGTVPIVLYCADSREIINNLFVFPMH